MPELPEVETVANGVHARVAGSRVRDVWFSSKPEPMKSTPERMAAELTNSRIARVHRVGKTVVFDLEKADGAPAQWLVHLGMTGRLLVNDPEVPQPAHTHAVLELSSGKELRFVDARRFGRMSIHADAEAVDRGRGGRVKAAVPGRKVRTKAAPDTASGTDASTDCGAAATRTRAAANPVAKPVYAGEGREPLTVSTEELAALFRGRRTAIKAALLNQSLLNGVGNIYADEALFRAGLRPRRMAGRLTRPQLEKLRLGLLDVLRKAIESGGSSVSDYVDADGERGFFQLEHRVYQRTGQPCLVCETPIRKVIVGGRSSHYCPQCQK